MSALERTSKALLLGISAVALLALPARAVPSFARQTGFSCDQCHTAFPELTPFGRAFKASGYTMTTEKSINARNKERSTLELVGLPPLSTMLQATYVHTAAPQQGDSGPVRNDNVALPEQLSLFVAGKIAPDLGAFIQATYSALDGSFGIDNVDLRYSKTGTLFGKSTVWGLTLNNNPTVTDLWHGTPAWGIPLSGSDMAPGPGAAPVVSDGLGQNSVGLGGYALWNNLVYLEAEGYRASPVGMLPVAQASSATDVLEGWAPYWRLALTHDFGPQSIEVGTFGLHGSLLGDGTTLSTPATEFTDLALDGQYQYILGDNVLTADATFVHESQSSGGTETAHLNATTLSASYLFRREIGVRLSYFDVGGGADVTSHVATADLNLVPWLNTEFTLRYTANFELDGQSGAAASDANSLTAIAWVAF